MWWPFKKHTEVPEEKRQGGDRRQPHIVVRMVLAVFNFVFVIVIWNGIIRPIWRFIIRFLMYLGLGLVLLIVGFIFVPEIIRTVDNMMPEFFDKNFGTDRSVIERLHDRAYFAQQSSFVNEDQKTVACISSPERRVLITDPADVPKLFELAIIASEDQRFSDHKGVDMLGIARAAGNRLLGVSMSGASTLEMQTAKELRKGTGRASTSKEKVRDIIMAIRIKQKFSKGQILLKYTNMPYLGRGAYGIEAASRAYFGKPAKELKLHQVAFIVSLINKPALPDRSYASDKSAKGPEAIRNANWQQVLRGTRRVLELMSGTITDDDYTRAADAIDNSLRAEVLPRGSNCGANGYFAEYVRQDLIKRGFRVDKSGLTVSLTRDDGIQDALEKAVYGLAVPTYEARHKNDPDIGELRAGAIAIEFTGDVLAEVGNINFRKYKYDVMAKGWRSPGSTFKIFTYGGDTEQLVNKAIMSGDQLPLEDMVARVIKDCSVLDAPIAVGMGRGRLSKWIHNFHTNSQPLYRGQISCALAVAESRNAAAMRAGQRAGMKNVLSLMYDRLGMPKDAKHPCLPYPTTAIGACDMNPLGMSAAATFLNGGYKVVPRFMNDVCKDGMSLLGKNELGGQRECDTKGEHREPFERVIHPVHSAVMIELLKGPVDIATGTVHSLRTGVIPGIDPLSPEIWQMKSEERKKRLLAFPIETSGEIAGKTGTATNADGRTSDVWLNLFIPGPPDHPEKGIMLIFWMGKDSKDHPLGERGTGTSKGYAESGGRNWTHAAATVLDFLKKNRGYLQPGFAFQPMVKDEVLLGMEARGSAASPTSTQEVTPDPDTPVIIDPADPTTPPELLKQLPAAEPEEPSSEPQAPLPVLPDGQPAVIPND